MPLTLSGSGGITYPDGSVNTTRSVSTAGDTMTGSLKATRFATGNATPSSLASINVDQSADTYAAIISNATGNFGLYTTGGGLRITDRTVSADRWILDSGGRVTIPNQPAFAALRTSVINQGNSWGTVSSWTTVFYNTGNHFNSTNGRFTAPVAGRYLFTYSFRGNDGSGTNAAIAARIIKNDTMFSYDIWGGPTIGIDSTYRSYVSASVVMDLNVNDYARVEIQGFFLQGNFSGMLIG